MNPFKVLLRQSVSHYRIAGEEIVLTVITFTHLTRFNSKELPFLDLKRHSQKSDFLLETRFLDWKRDFWIGNAVYGLETRF